MEFGTQLNFFDKKVFLRPILCQVRLTKVGKRSASIVPCMDRASQGWSHPQGLEISFLKIENKGGEHRWLKLILSEGTDKNKLDQQKNTFLLFPHAVKGKRFCCGKSVKINQVLRYKQVLLPDNLLFSIISKIKCYFHLISKPIQMFRDRFILNLHPFFST